MNLVAELVEVETDKAVELDKRAVVSEVEGDGASHCYWHAVVGQTWVEYIKIGHTKFHLVIALQVDEIHLGLEWRVAPECHTHNACQHGEVGGLNSVVKGAQDKVLHGAVLLLIYKDSQLAVFNPQAAAIAYAVFTTCSVGLFSWSPFPHKIIFFIAADYVHCAAAFSFSKYSHIKLF